MPYGSRAMVNFRSSLVKSRGLRNRIESVEQSILRLQGAPSESEERFQVPDNHWDEYFARATVGRSWLRNVSQEWYHLQPIFDVVENTVPTGSRIVEVGSGLGLTALYFASAGFDVTGIDINPQAVAFAQESIQPLFPSTLRFEPGDAFKLEAPEKPYDLAYSLGVVEHFERNQTVELLHLQGTIARFVLAVIPTPFTRYAGGIHDERFYGRFGLRSIAEDAGLKVHKLFGYGDIPSPIHQTIRRWAPPALISWLRNYVSYGMGVGVLAESAAET